MEQLSLFDTHIDMDEPSKKWLLIDGNNLMNRCYYATAINPKGLLKAPDGRYTNAVSLFLRVFLKYRKELKADVAVMFDKGKGYRKELYEAYKEGRNATPSPLKEQFPLIQEILKGIGVPVYVHNTYEADDLIASFAESVDVPVYILSNDRDLLQLVSERIQVIVRKGTNDVYYTPSVFHKEYDGLLPQQIVDLKSIMGDSSDNIPGIPGIGEKGALKLVQTFGTVENMIEQIGSFPKELKRYEAKVQEGKEQALLAKRLTILQKDVSIKKEPFRLNEEQLKEYCVELGIKSLFSAL